MNPETLAALGEPNRFRIVELLRTGPRPVSEIGGRLRLRQSQVSQHLKVLKEAGLVRDRPEGTQRVYYIDPNGLGALRAWLDQFWDQALAAFQQEIERDHEGERKR